MMCTINCTSRYNINNIIDYMRRKFNEKIEKNYVRYVCINV